jgi:4-diphosphocytidyl-2-C-methyl-D-erythritol kinase
VWEGTAPAKVNLLLRVLARETTGYHQVETVYQSLALADGVRVELSPGRGTRLEVEGVARGALGPEGANLAVVAVERFRAALGDAGKGLPSVLVRLIKRIPHGAGLGGGSSDAAAVLRGLSSLMEEPLAPGELMAIGAGIGSDVPFFLSGASRSLARGRGERLLPLRALPERDVLLAVPPVPIATGWAYETLAARRTGERGSAHGVPRYDPDAATWNGVGARAINDFEEVLFPLRPELGHLKDVLLRAGATLALLSGSGSALFGVFEDRGALDRASAQLEVMDAGVRTIRTRTV